VQAAMKLGFIFLFLATLTFIVLYFLGHILPIAAIGGGIVIIAVIFFSLLFALLVLLLAIFYALKKKPNIEKSGNWTIERIKGKGEDQR
jgi:hypothetical protein